MKFIIVLSGNHNLDAIADIQFRHQRGHVVLDSLLAYFQRVSNFPVGSRLQQLTHDLLLPNVQAGSLCQ